MEKELLKQDLNILLSDIKNLKESGFSKKPEELNHLKELLNMLTELVDTTKNHIYDNITEKINQEFNFYGKNKDLKINKDNKIEITLPTNKTKESYFLEILQTIDRIIIDKIFNSNKYTKINKLDKFVKFVNDNKDKKSCLITNGKIALYLQDYNINKDDQLFNHTTNGCTYYAGKINNIEIYVDPYIRWNDDRCAIIFGDFYNFQFNEYNEEKLKNYPDIKYAGTIYVEFSEINSKLFKFNNIDF
jgi:hypothetical protein